MRHTRNVRSRGFTLLELIVVITIIGVLSTLAVLQLRGLPGEARRTAVRADMQSILSAVKSTYVMIGSYPESIDDLVDREGRGLGGGGLEQRPIDPWGNDYIFELLDGRPVVTCYGRDGVEGGDGEDADLVLPESS